MNLFLLDSVVMRLDVSLPVALACYVMILIPAVTDLMSSEDLNTTPVIV